MSSLASGIASGTGSTGSITISSGTGTNSWSNNNWTYPNPYPPLTLSTPSPTLPKEELPVATLNSLRSFVVNLDILVDTNLWGIILAHLGPNNTINDNELQALSEYLLTFDSNNRTPYPTSSCLATLRKVLNIFALLTSMHNLLLTYVDHTRSHLVIEMAKPNNNPTINILPSVIHDFIEMFGEIEVADEE